MLNGRIIAALVLLVTLPLVACDRTNGATKETTEAAHAEESAGNVDQHDDHDGKEHDEHGSVNMTEKSRAEFGVTIAMAGSADLSIYITVPGEISVNEDRFAHVVPRVGGVVTEVIKTWGDKVKQGETLAILESQDLGAMKAAYLSAVERKSLAQAVFDREARLWEKRITSEQEYLNAKRDHADADITYREKRQALLSLGILPEDLRRISSSTKESLTRYKIIAPFTGIVIDKHLTLGEAVEANNTVYQIGDLSEVWANLSVYQKDLGKIRKGALAMVSGPDGVPKGAGEISYVRPIIGEQTRTALARIVLANPERLWRPGLFVEARVSVDSFNVPIAVQVSAIQKKDGENIVFVEDADGDLSARVVVTGRSDNLFVEIIAGLRVGERYVCKGSFVVKAESEKEAFGGQGHHH